MMPVAGHQRSQYALANAAIGDAQSLGRPDVEDRIENGAARHHQIGAFLADADRLNRGLGTAMIQAFAQQLFEDPAVTKVQTDPSPENLRAMRCYATAGFLSVGQVQTPDGPAVLMVCERR